MKKILVILCLTAIAFSCSKPKEDPPPSHPGYGCVFGKSKTSSKVDYLGCWHNRVFACGTNQTAVNNVSAQLNIPVVQTAILFNYTNWEFVPNDNCDCQ